MSPEESTLFFHVCTCAAGMIGVPANAAALVYLSVGDHGVHPATVLIYRAVAATDLVLALTLSAIAVQFLTGQHPNNRFLCEAIEFGADTSVRLLYLLLCLLAVLRALVITWPHRHTLARHTHTTKRVIAGAVIVLSLQSLVPIAVRIARQTPSCKTSLSLTFEDPAVYMSWRACTVLLQAGAALLVMLLANAASMRGLLKGRAVECSRRGARGRAALTSLLLTTSFFLLHVTGVAHETARLMGVDLTWINPHIANGVSVLSPILDPVLYFLRLPAACIQVHARVSTVTQYTLVTGERSLLRRISSLSVTSRRESGISRKESGILRKDSSFLSGSRKDSSLLSLGKQDSVASSNGVRKSGSGELRPGVLGKGGSRELLKVTPTTVREESL